MSARRSTVASNTKHGGLHYLFDPQGIGYTSADGALAEAVDVKGSGGYIAIPPSAGYEVVDDSPVAPLPGWLAKLLPVVGERRLLPGATSMELETQIRMAAGFHAATNELAVIYRRNGLHMADIIEKIYEQFDASGAARSAHPEHRRWADRRGDVERSVKGLFAKYPDGAASDEFLRT